VHSATNDDEVVLRQVINRFITLMQNVCAGANRARILVPQKEKLGFQGLVTVDPSDVVAVGDVPFSSSVTNP
jgi:hypothetical protein